VSGPARIQMFGPARFDQPLHIIRVDFGNWANPYARPDIQAEPALLLALYCDFLKSDDRKAAWIRAHLDDLRGKTLACACPIGQPCHADVLLDLVNQPTAASAA
jgi:hypothetical protein